MTDHTTCPGCIALKKELSGLRRFKAEVKQAFDTDSLERLHLASEVVGLAQQAVVLWGMSPLEIATFEAMEELDRAVRAMMEGGKP